MIALCLCINIVPVVVTAAVKTQSESSKATHAVGDSDIGAFYQIDNVRDKTPGILLREEPLEEHQSLEYVMYCLRPLAVRFEAEYNNKLLSRADYEKGYRFKVNLRALLRGDINTQTDHLNRMVVAGVMSRNEARDFLGLPSKDGLDEMLIPVNLFNKDNEKDGGETESKSYSEKILSDIVRSTSN